MSTERPKAVQAAFAKVIGMEKKNNILKAREQTLKKNNAESICLRRWESCKNMIEILMHKGTH